MAPYEPFDLNMLATIKEDPAVTDARRRRYVEIFGPTSAGKGQEIRLPGGGEAPEARIISLDARRRERNPVAG